MTRRSLVRGAVYGTLIAALLFAALSLILGGALTTVTGSVAGLAALTFWLIAFLVWFVSANLGWWD